MSQEVAHKYEYTLSVCTMRAADRSTWASQIASYEQNEKGPPAKLMFLDCSIVLSSLMGIPDSSSLLCFTAWVCERWCDSTTCD